MSPLVRVVSVVSVVLCGSARLCFALVCVGRKRLAMILLGVRNYDRRSLCWRRAWLLCWLVLCDSWAALPMVPGNWSMRVASWRSFVNINVNVNNLHCVGCRCSLSFVFLGGSKCWELSLANTEVQSPQGDD